MVGATEPLSPKQRAAALTWTLLRAGLALLYLASGALKLRDPAAFAVALENYRLVTPWGAAALAVVVPWWEIATGVALFGGRTWRAAGWLAAMALGCGFSIFVISAWARGLDASCGCFGGSGRIGLLATGRALGLLGLAAAGYWRECGNSDSAR